MHGSIRAKGPPWSRAAAGRTPPRKCSGEPFDTYWPLRYEIKWPSEVLSAKAAWQAAVFDAQPNQQTIAALVLAADKLYLAGSEGELQVRSIADGKLLAKQGLAPPVWDGMAVAGGRLLVSTRQGQVVCLGQP